MTTKATPGESRFSRGVGLIRGLVRLSPGSFVVAVSGAAVFAICTAGSSLGVRWIIDHVVVPRFEDGHVALSTVVGGCVLIVTIALVRAAGVVVRRTFAGMTEWGVAERLGMQVVSRYSVQPVAWHRRHSAGDLVARAGVDVEAAVAVLAPLPYGSSVVLMLIVSAFGLVVLDPVLGAVACVVIPVLVLTNVVYQRRVDAHFDEAQQQMGKLSEAALESFEGVTVVKAFGAEERETERLATITGLLRDARVRSMKARANFEMMLDGVHPVANLAMLCVGALRVRSGDVSIGELAAAMFLFTLLVVPLRLIGYVFSELPHSAAGFARVQSICDEGLVPDPRSHIVELSGQNALEARGLTVHHIPEVAVIKDASLTVRRGEIVALVGATGSGKTTLLEAVAGLVPVSEGTLAVAGGRATLVFQEAFLFSESVRHNICLGFDIDDATIAEAVRVADAAFLFELEHGLDTPLGERGVSLSGGQRQRLALVRALVRRPGLLLLDDTTSALDPRTELSVLGNLRDTGLVQGMLMVASRPSAISMADRVAFVLPGGRLVSGTHQELLASAPGYRELIEAFDDDRRSSEEVS